MGLTLFICVLCLGIGYGIGRTDNEVTLEHFTSELKKEIVHVHVMSTKPLDEMLSAEELSKHFEEVNE